MSENIEEQASGNTLYVAPNGSDSAKGTESAPLKTINKGIDKLQAGGTLIVRGGTYGESVSGGIPSGANWGGATKIQAAAGEEVIVRPTANQGPARVFSFESGQKFIIIDGITIDAKNAVYECVKVSSANHIRVVNCNLINAHQHAFLTSYGAGSAYNQIINCLIHTIGSDPQFQHAIYLAGPENVVEGCTIHHAASAGIQLYGEAGMDRNVFRNNTFYSCKRGVGIYGGDANEVYNNVIYDVTDYGILIRDDFSDLSNNKVFNNTVYKAGETGIYYVSGKAGNKIRNNISYESGGIVNEGGNAELSNNFKDDPSFVDADRGNLQLKAGSPCIDAGKTLGLVTTDRLGVARPQGSAYDIGAYEYCS